MNKVKKSKPKSNIAIPSKSYISNWSKINSRRKAARAKLRKKSMSKQFKQRIKRLTNRRRKPRNL